MARKSSITHSRHISKRYDKLRKRVRDEYELPSLTAADAFIAAYYEDYERQRKAMAELLNGGKKSAKESRDAVSDILYGGVVI